MSYIEKVEIDGLFGRFNYTIDLTGDKGGLSILTAPNGFGKSTILKIIESFSNGDFWYFLKEDFTAIRFFISGESDVEIKHKEQGKSIIISNGEKETVIDDPFDDNSDDLRSFAVERALPFLSRIGPRTWRHDSTGEILDRVEIISRYRDHPIFRRKNRREAWIEKIISSLRVFSITTNRLKNDVESNERNGSARKDSFMVSHIAENIKDQIRSSIRNQFEEGRKKETSFPTRLMEALKNQNPPSKKSVLDSINALQLLEERYGRLGIIPNTEATKQLNMHLDSTESTGLLVLKTYLDDIMEKFSLLDHLSQRLDVFCSSVNQLLSFKEIVTSADDGVVVKMTDGDKRNISLTGLSSGEQHLLVLLGRLIFDTRKGSLVLIDEPEISFHPEWQEGFISILNEIKELNGFNVMLATHSPILIGDNYWGNVIELADQYQEPEKIPSFKNMDI